MTGCCAEGCSNSSTKGFVMKRFPKDPDMRNQWQINTRRGNWKPNDNSYLCEVCCIKHHFTGTIESLKIVILLGSFCPKNVGENTCRWYSETEEMCCTNYFFF